MHKDTDKPAPTVFEIWARGNALDTSKLPHGAYRSMVTFWAHRAWDMPSSVERMITSLQRHAGSVGCASIDLHFSEGVGWYVTMTCYAQQDKDEYDFVTKTYSELSTALEVAISRI